jgi:hypothetical protein
MRGGTLVAALLGILCATAVVPPGAAWWLNARRISTTHERIDRMAGVLMRGSGQAHVFATGVRVVCGPGRLPEGNASLTSAVHEAWVTAATMAPDAFGAEGDTDAWGRCLLLEVGTGGHGTAGWLLSAGPNGAIETPLGAPQLGGDDIGRQVR